MKAIIISQSLGTRSRHPPLPLPPPTPSFVYLQSAKITSHLGHACTLNAVFGYLQCHLCLLSVPPGMPCSVICVFTKRHCVVFFSLKRRQCFLCSVMGLLRVSEQCFCVQCISCVIFVGLNTTNVFYSTLFGMHLLTLLVFFALIIGSVTLTIIIIAMKMIINSSNAK